MNQTNQITRVSGMNVKGQNFAHSLGALTILHGDNASGKTAVTDAILIALLGHHPALGKKAGATMTLAPAEARQMEIEIESAAGRLRRTFTRTKTGASLETHGVEPTIPTAQLHFGAFLQAKPTERHQILNSLMGRIDVEALIARVKEKHAGLGISEIGFEIDPMADDPLAAGIAELAETGKQLKQDIDASRKTLATLTSEDAPTPPDPKLIAQIEQQIAEDNRLIGQLEEKADRLIELQQRAPDRPHDPEPDPDETRRMTAEREKLLGRIGEAEAAKNQRFATENAITRLRGQQNLLEQKAREAKEPRPESTPDQVEQEKADLKQQADEVSKRIQAINRTLGEANSTVEAKHRQLESLKKHGECPTCGTKGKDLEAAMETIREALDAAIAKKTAIEDQLKAATKESNDLIEQQAAKQAEAHQLDAWAAAAALDAVERELKDTEESLGEAPDIGAMKEEAARLAGHLLRRDELASEWDWFKSATIPTAEQVEQANAALKASTDARAERQTRLQAARNQQAEHDRALADQRRISELTEQAEKHEKLLAGVKELRAFLIEQQRAAAAEAMKPLLKIAGVFTAGLFDGELAVREHELGINRGSAFIPLEVMSGMEMTATAAACQAALATQGDTPILIVDELARMTPRNRAKFAENCMQAIDEGIIAQAILVDHSIEHHTADATLIRVA